MTRSLSGNASCTITDARYVGAKIGADLRQLRAIYGKPEDTAKISAYAEEVAQLLKYGYLDSVSYGFREPDSNLWKLRLRYRATLGGRLLDGNPGQLPRTANVSGLPFYSFINYSTKFHSLPPSAQTDFEQTLPITRTTGVEPTTGIGGTTPGTGYSRSGTGVTRDTFVASDH
ncbi:hypothetical protein [Amycolatopsis sp. 3B14]|uniref:HORMA-1 domain-containing protein n=1 Tax=Amycolatopsis sp. 3B14 TaxID=3243600 RepID=UPI003D98490A